MSCDLCGGLSTELEVFPKAHVCNDCGFVHVPTRRTPEAIADDWENVYKGGYDPQWPGVQARLFYVAQFLENRFDVVDLLDIGAGDGSFLDFCSQNSVECSGIEPSAENIRKWNPEHTDYHGAWEDFDDIEHYDLCTINWTLENCGDPIGMLEFAAEHADLVSVATGSRILVPFKKPFSSYFTDKEHADLHAFRWSRKSLTHAMAKAGMVVVEENDWMDRDEMILVGRKTDELVVGDYDDPQEVQEYFRLWKKLWS